MTNQREKTILALMAGIAAGIGLGILFAPGKGEKTRKQIKKKVLSQFEALKNEAGGLKAGLDEKMEMAEEKLDRVMTSIVQEGKEATEELIKKLESKLASLREKAPKK